MRTNFLRSVVASACLLTLSAGLIGTAEAAPNSAAAKQYLKIVAPFDKLLVQPKAPPVPAINAAFATVEKNLSAAHWTGKTSGDIKTEVSAVKAFLTVVITYAKHPNSSAPAGAQGLLTGLVNGANRVRKDLGLPKENQNQSPI